MRLVITVTDETMTASADGAHAEPIAGGASRAVSEQPLDGGPMPDFLRAMAAEVDAGRIPPPGRAG